MARMVRTIISLPEEEKKWLEAHGRRHGISSAQVVRLAVRDYHGRMSEASAPHVKGVREDRADYGPPLPRDLTDIAELKRRAAAAAGRFASGISNLSVDHDRHISEETPAGPDREQGQGEAGGDRRRKRGSGRTR